MAVETARQPDGLWSPARIGLVNRSLVLELLHQEGPSSRAQLARALGVTRGTIATILQPLIDNGTLVEGEQASVTSAGGKPARPLWFSRQGRELGSMRLGPRAVTTARMGIDGTVHQRAHVELDPAGGVDALRTAILSVADKCFAGRALLGIGVGSAGMVDTTTGTIVALNLAPALDGFPLGPLLRDRFGVPVAIDHHPRVQALGDKWFGQGRARRSFASVFTGEVLGMGIVHDNKIFSGIAGAGGEYGHMVVDMDGAPCLCGRHGCWETVASTPWLRREAARRGLRNAETANCENLTDAAGTGDEGAVQLLDLYARNLAIGMANNEHTLASGTYIVHGDAATGGERFLTALTRWMRAFAPRRGPEPEVILGTSDDEMTLLGGGGLILSQLIGSVQ